MTTPEDNPRDDEELHAECEAAEIERLTAENARLNAANKARAALKGAT